MDKPFIPYDVDNGPEPEEVTEDTTTADGSPAVTDNPLPQITRTERQPDGTEVQKPTTKSGRTKKSKGGKVL